MKYVPEDRYLLIKNDIEIEDENEIHQKEISSKELESYIKQKPNKKVLGFRFHLSLYSLSNKEKPEEKSWLKRIGETPVIWDSTQTRRTVNQLSLFLSNKGYYNNEVEYSVGHERKLLKDKRIAKVDYKVVLNEPYTIRDISHEIMDTTLDDLILEDTVFSLLQPGMNFDVDVLQDERERVENKLKNLGYFNFVKEYIFFEADSSLGSTDLEVDVKMVVKKFQYENSKGEYETGNHRRYAIRNVYYFTDYSTKDALLDYSKYVSDLDTLAFDENLYFIKKNSFPVKPKSFVQYSYIIPGAIYQKSDVEKTYTHLGSLRVFKLVNIQFKETGRQDENGDYLLDCVVQTSPFVKQSYTIELEGTNSENIGIGAAATYNHRNLFRGAENFDFKVRGSYEFIRDTSLSQDNEKEFGVEASISTPKFLIPFNNRGFVKKFHPKTSISLAYSYQQSPLYTRTIANSTFGYIWQGNKYLTHIVNPFQLNLINSDLSDQWREAIDSSFTLNLYIPHIIANSGYSVIYTNQNVAKNTDLFYIRWNIESAGNLLGSLYNIAGIAPNDSGNYELFNTDFSQFMRSDIDLRYYQQLNKTDVMAYRVFIGAGFPYGNSSLIPFEKRYFSGGANSMRAWFARSLGPGTEERDPSFKYFNNTGDMKLELNLEYRFRIFWKFEGALFGDIGNVWELTREESSQQALFELNSFYKELAVATGVGLRFDLSFFVMRLDFAIKARDPRATLDNPWLFGNRKLTPDDYAFNIGIGYPF